MKRSKLKLEEAVKISRERIQHLKNQQQLFGLDLSSLIHGEIEWLEKLEDALNQQQRNQTKE